MRVTSIIARIVLGLLFTVFGLNGFLNFIPRPPLDGNIALFMTVIFQSHFSMFIFGAQLLAGLMLLTNQYVRLAIVVLGAVLANILAFHITMQPAGLPMALITTLLWVLAAWPMRAIFAPLFSRTS